jgi:hypothetical protein
MSRIHVETIRPVGQSSSPCVPIHPHSSTNGRQLRVLTRFIENGTTVDVPDDFVLGIPRDVLGGRPISPFTNLVRLVGPAKDVTRHDTIVHHSVNSFDVVIRLALGMVFILDQVPERLPRTRISHAQIVPHWIRPRLNLVGKTANAVNAAKVSFDSCIIRPLASRQTVQAFVEPPSGPRRARLDRARQL